MTICMVIVGGLAEIWRVVEYDLQEGRQADVDAESDFGLAGEAASDTVAITL